MSIKFFLTDTGELYADMEKTSFDDETYRWLSSRGIDLGRRSSFTISVESTLFDNFTEAEQWFSETLPKSKKNEHELDLENSSLEDQSLLSG
jgi:hypothetical protein